MNVNYDSDAWEAKIKHADRGDPSTTHCVRAQGERVFHSDTGELIRMKTEAIRSS